MAEQVNSICRVTWELVLLRGRLRHFCSWQISRDLSQTISILQLVPETRGIRSTDPDNEIIAGIVLLKILHKSNNIYICIKANGTKYCLQDNPKVHEKEKMKFGIIIGFYICSFSSNWFYLGIERTETEWLLISVWYSKKKIIFYIPRNVLICSFHRIQMCNF